LIERAEPIEILLQSHKRRIILRLLGLGLIQRGPEQPRIDLGEHVVFLDVLAFLEKHVLQFAVDLRVDADREGRLRRAEAGEIDRHILRITFATLTGTAGGWLRATCAGLTLRQVK